MSRPPRPHYRVSTTGAQDGRREGFDFFPHEFRGLVELERALAFSELKLIPSDSRESGGGSVEVGEERLVLVPEDSTGDLTRTMFEISALVAHMLGIYQDLYARESYLGLAQSARSLVLHARRLAYQPDQGVSATGYVVLTIRDGLEGELPKRFGFASTPFGEISAQDYETLEKTKVNCQWNDLRPVEASLPVGSLQFNAGGEAEIVVAGDAALELRPGQRLLLLSDAVQQTLRLVSVSAGPDGNSVLSVEGGAADQVVAVPEYDEDDPTTHVTLLADPEVTLRSFAWNAPSSSFPASLVQSATGYFAPAETGGNIGTVELGYASHHANDIYFSGEAPETLLDTWIVAEANSGVSVYQVDGLELRPVTLIRGEIIGIEVPLLEESGLPQIGGDGLVDTQEVPRLVESEISETVSVARLGEVGGGLETRSSIDFPATFRGGFLTRLRVLDRLPNPAVLSQPVEFSPSMEGMKPGRRVVLSTLDESTAQVIEVRKLEAAGTPEQPATLLHWHEGTSMPPGFGGFLLSNVKISGNVTRVVHGKTDSEILGSSDGLTPFLRFPLKGIPLTRVPGADGSEPDIEVRVNDVRWQRVEDFHDSAPEDRHYILETAEDGTVTVVFPDGLNGAIPGSGKKNISAEYRVNLGVEGNAASGRVSRIKKAHPLLSRALNHLDIDGGAEPADAEDIRHQATRYIRTFDRAVSASDHSDLALLFPGIARARARWDNLEGIRMVVAEADGTAPASKSELKSFLDRRRDASQPLLLLDPVPVDVFLTVNLEHSSDFLPENVKAAVQDVLYGEDEDSPGLFSFQSRDFGQPAHLSQVYKAVSGVEGVTLVSVSRFALEAGGVRNDVLQVLSEEWLRLLPENCLLLITEEAGS